MVVESELVSAVELQSPANKIIRDVGICVFLPELISISALWRSGSAPGS